MIRTVTIANLAPTGEGVTRTADGVGFVAGALPGESVEAEVLEVRKRFWKGRAVSIGTRSPLRRSGAHAAGCAGCDWSYFDVDAARQAKRELFLETMERIGGLPAGPFGDLPIEASPLAYRLRCRFHCSGSGEEARLGYFAPRTHRVEPAEDCEALSDSLRVLLPRLTEAVASSGVVVAEIAVAEDLSGARRLARAVLPLRAGRGGANALLGAMAGLFDGVRVAAAEGPILAGSGESRLWLPVAGREFPLTAGTFFQTNRHLLALLYGDVAKQAASAGPGRALDLFSGVGFFAGALLDAGHEVVSVEANHAAVEQAAAARKRWGTRENAWRIQHAEALAFLERNRETFDLAVVDPPRAGLGLPLCRALAGRAGRLLYVSCEPATLGRDLEALVAAGLQIRGGKLYDLFPLTHRVEAIVALSPPRTP